MSFQSDLQEHARIFLSRARQAVGAPDMFDVSRILAVWGRSAPASHVVVIAAVMIAVCSMMVSVIAVDRAAGAVVAWRRMAGAATVPLPTIIRRIPDPAQVAAVRNALAGAYPDVTIKDVGAELTISVSGPEKLPAFRAAAQRLQILDPQIRWDVSLLCAGKGCPQLAQMVVVGAIPDIKIEKDY